MLVVVVGDVFFGFKNLQFFDSASFSLTRKVAIESGYNTFVYSGLLDIAGNAVGVDLRPAIAVTGFLFLPDHYIEITEALFVLPRPR